MVVSLNSYNNQINKYFSNRQPHFEFVIFKTQKKSFFKIIQLMVFILLYQAIFEHKNEVEIEEEIPEVEICTLPTFKEKREKMIKKYFI